MSSSLPQTATNSQSLNGIITLSDGVITIEDGVISGLTELDLTDIQVSGTATIENLVVNNQIDMTLGQIKNVSAPTDNGDATNKQYVDGNFLNKVTTTTQNVASRLTFNNTTGGSSFPIINIENAITGSNNGMYLRFFKNFNRLPNTEIGSIVFADKDTISPAISRAVQLTASIDSASDPLLNITFDSGIFNPLTITNTQTILRNNNFYLVNKTTTQNVFTYINSTDKFTMFKPLDMNTTNKIINLSDPVSAQDASTKNYTDTHSNNQNYLLRDGSLPMLGAIDMNTTNKIINLSDPVSAQDASTKNYTDTNFLNKTTTSTQDVKGKLVFDDISQDIITFQNDLATASNGMRLLFKKDVVAHPFLYVGGFTWADLNSGGSVRRMVEMAISNDGSTMPVFSMIMNTGAFTPVIINTTQTTLRNKEFYFINQQDSTNILTYLNSTNKIKMYKELDCANIISTGNLSCVNLTTTGNQVLGTNSTNSLDVKSSTSFEADVLVKNNNHLMLGGNPTSIGGMRLIYDASFQTNGTAYFDARATSLKIRLTTISDPTTDRVEINNSATTIKNNLIVDGNTTLGNSPTGDTLTFNCQATFPTNSKLTFDTGSYIDSARIRIIPSGNSSFQLNTTNVENGVYCDNTSPITITMPNKNAYWNDRHYIIKVLSQDVDIDPPTGVTIDNSTSTINVGGSYRSFQFVFTSDFSTTGKIFIIGDK